MPDVDKLRKKHIGASKDTKKSFPEKEGGSNNQKANGSNEGTVGGRKLKDLPAGVYSAAPSLFSKDGKSESQNDSKLEEDTRTSKVYEALKGAKVDKSGNIISRSGTILGQADGKLSKMVGKKVNWQGEIVDKKGKVLGTVTNTTEAVSRGGSNLNAVYERTKEAYGIDGDKSIDKFAKSAYKSAHGASKSFAKATNAKKPQEKNLFEYGDMKMKMNTNSETVTFSFSLPQQQLKTLYQQLETTIG